MSLINSRKQACDEALKTTRNEPGTCQLVTRGWYDAPSAGDVDHDGDADAKDGWLSEPFKYRHAGDRNPPWGVPLYFAKDGGKGFGHRCMTLHQVGRLRSTDMFDNHYQAGVTSTVTGRTQSEAIAVIEAAMGLTYVGWSESIDGFLIPDFAPKPQPPVVKTRGPHVDAAIKEAAHATAPKGPKGAERRSLLDRALALLRRIKPRTKRP